MFTRKTPFILVALMGLFFVGCGEFEVPDGYELVKKANFTPPPPLPPSDGISWTSAWQSKLSGPGFLPANPIIAFEIPHTDINASFTSTQSRAYLALDETISPPEYHLVIVGVDNATGKDDTSVMYDLTTPCPITCDTSSILYHNRRN